MATEPQVRYALMLLQQAGYSTRYMNSEFKKLGATMRERSGTVESWLRQLDVGRASWLIDHLKAAPARAAQAAREQASAAACKVAACAVGPQLAKPPTT